jgi:hypothetical protein
MSLHKSGGKKIKDLVGFLYVGYILQKQILVRCWTRCGNMWNKIMWALISRLSYAPYLLNLSYGNLMCLRVRQDAISLFFYWRFSCIVYLLKMCQHLRNLVIWFKNIFVLDLTLFQLWFKARTDQQAHAYSGYVYEDWKPNWRLRRPSYCVLRFLVCSLLFVSLSCVTLIQV